MRIPDAVYEAAPCDNPRFRVQILFAVFLGVAFDYPMLQFKPTLEQMVERLGPERIIWGTDVPILMRYTTYRQSLDQIRLYCDDLLGEDGMALVLGRNMARLMGLEPPPDIQRRSDLDQSPPVVAPSAISLYSATRARG